MRIAFVINDRFCPAGIVADAVADAGHAFFELYPHEGEALPEEVPESWDGVVVFGGRMGAYDDAEHPAMPHLTRLIAKAHASGTPFLGVCLGAQQLARALGGPKVTLETAEFGFVPMTVTPQGREDPLLRGLDAPAVMQVHQDSYVIPDGGVHLMSGDDVANQAYRVGPLSYAFQCHFEVTQEDLITWLDALENKYGQSLNAKQAELVRTSRADRATLLPAAQKFGTEVTRRWLELAERARAS